MTTSTPKQKRAPRGLYITERDLFVLETLLRYRVVRQSTLHALCFPTVSFTYPHTVQLRLKKLSDECLIERRFFRKPSPKNVGFIDYTHQHRRQPIYWITAKGASLLINERNYKVEAGDPSLYWITAKGASLLINERNYKVEAGDPSLKRRLKQIEKKAATSESYLNHYLDLRDIRACIHLAIANTPGMDLVVWIDEDDQDEKRNYLLREKVEVAGFSRPQDLRPDAGFIIKDDLGHEEKFYIESDEGNMESKRWRKRVLVYNTYGAVQKNPFRVLTVTRERHDKNHQQQLNFLLNATRDSLGDINPENKPYKGGRRFWYTTFNEIMPDSHASGEHVFQSPIWLRVDEQELDRGEYLALQDYVFGLDIKKKS